MKKSNSFKKAAALILALLWILSACELSGEEEKQNGNSGSISIMTWNMQALFDEVDDGIEYDDYLSSAGWSKEKYQGRISLIAKAIGGMTATPDIIAIQEVESARVVSDLAAALSGHGYTWTHFANSPDMSLGVGIISRYPFKETRSHSININGDASPRPVLEVRVNTEKAHAKNEAGDSSLVLFICHWKSKLGGEALTEEARRASARIIIRRMRELAEYEPGLPVLIMGDLNENHDEFYRRNGEAICALLPDDPRSAELTGFYGIDADDASLSAQLQKDFIIISKNKPPQARFFSGQPMVLYSPWTNELENGSYYYKNAWETIDHFLLSQQLFDGSEWEFDSCAVINYPPFASTVRRPMAYNPRTGSGLSDHLPLLLLLKWK